MSANAPRVRLLYIDNLRWTMILLVLSMHAIDTYSPFGNWYYTEHPHVSLPTALFFGLYQSFLQAFFMGLLFFIAGYFAAPSLDRKGPGAFAVERLFRLGLPTALYMVAIGPLTQYFLSNSWGSGGFAHQWYQHLSDGQILSETGPMWFAAALLAFCLIYAGWRAWMPPARQKNDAPDYREVVLFTAVLSLSTFLVRIPFPENVSVLNVHPGDFAQYILMFCSGTVAHRRQWLSAPSPRFAATVATVSLGVSVFVLACLVGWGGALHGDTSRYPGGANVTSFFKCFWEALVCVGMTFGLIAGYRAVAYRQGRLAKLLSDNAFAVYLVHPPILIAIALAMRGISAPAVLKALSLTIATAVVAFSLSHLVLRRVKVLKKIL